MQASLINNGRDLHLHHGPIDLIINAVGPQLSVSRAQKLAQARFASVLTGLVAELEVLRQPVASSCNVTDPVAVRMWQATSKFSCNHFVTPMASVAGAVADEVLASILAEVHDLEKVSVNNGGDIAFWQAEGQSTKVGVVDPVSGELLARAVINNCDCVGGIATSGRHGRSLSCGIADSVTVLADNASSADAAATLIANAVDLPDNPQVRRVAATEIDPDTDLGNTAVTVDVGHLSDHDCQLALRNGLAVADGFLRRPGSGIKAAYLVLQGHCVVTDSFNMLDRAVQINQIGGYANA